MQEMLKTSTESEAVNGIIDNQSIDRYQERDGYCIGIESTADDFGVGIVSFDGEILANIHSTYVPETGGIHPREAARHHADNAGETLKKAFNRADIKPTEIDIVSFSQGPGLGPCLRTGATTARSLASYLRIPLVGVNHCVAHIEIGKHTTRAKDPVSLYVSGGNTIVSAFGGGRYRVFGETLDIAVGNLLDVFARKVNLPKEKEMPYGAIVERFANQGDTFVSLPYTVKGMDLSFSGLLTASVQMYQNSEYQIEDLCFSLQEVAFSMLTEVTERALAHTEKSEILLTGGVAANKRLQKMLADVSDEHQVRLNVVPKEYALDNGVMIAWTGILSFKHRITLPIERSQVRLKWRLEDAPAPWAMKNLN